MMLSLSPHLFSPYCLHRARFSAFLSSQSLVRAGKYVLWSCGARSGREAVKKGYEMRRGRRPYVFEVYSPTKERLELHGRHKLCRVGFALEEPDLEEEKLPVSLCRRELAPGKE